MRSIASKTSVALIASLGLVGALAACSSPATTDTSAGSSTSGITGPYKDGTYTESADYSAPSGTETVDVTITLAADIITDVQVEGHATDPQAQLHQGQFTSGIAAVVVGKDIDDIKVDKVGGSSLTSGGFNKAVEAIKADATA